MLSFCSRDFKRCHELLLLLVTHLDYSIACEIKNNNNSSNNNNNNNCFLQWSQHIGTDGFVGVVGEPSISVVVDNNNNNNFELLLWRNVFLAISFCLKCNNNNNSFGVDVNFSDLVYCCSRLVARLTDPSVVVVRLGDSTNNNSDDLLLSNPSWIRCVSLFCRTIATWIPLLVQTTRKQAGKNNKNNNNNSNNNNNKYSEELFLKKSEEIETIHSSSSCDRQQKGKDYVNLVAEMYAAILGMLLLLLS